MSVFFLFFLDSVEEAYGHFVFTPPPEEANDSLPWAADIGHLLEEGCFHLSDVLEGRGDIDADSQIDGECCF